MDNLVVGKVTLALQEAILKKELEATSATGIIAKGMELMQTFPNMSGDQKKKLLVQVIEKLAAGQDGIVGTSDDIIPAACVESLKTFLEKDLLGDVINVVLDASRGKFNLQKATETAEKVKKACFPFLTALFKKSKEKKQKTVETKVIS